jgi:DNA helicase HerA-like ATPase
MLSELRKFRVSLILATQFLGSLDRPIRDAVFGNVGSIISFRLGAADASYMSREFAPVFTTEDLVALERFHVCVRLQVDNQQSRPFSACTLASIDGL